MNGYGAFAAFYDALTEDVDYAAWAEYLLEVFSRHGGTANQLLDLACGSGSLSLELSSRGVDVIGVDGSADMLAIAREKSAEAGEDVLFLCQDMRELDLYGTVDGAVCLLDSLSHILDTADLSEIFRRLGLFIAPGGLLIFDVNTPHKHAVTLGDNAFVYELPEFLCVWRNRYSSSNGEVSMQLDFFLEEDGTYQRYTDEVRERAYAMTTWKRLLTEAGFDLEAVYGERSFDMPDEQADRWVFVARNRAICQRNGE
ncbi:MAG: class I SAM-dependent methyltransferase [Ruminococcaceae bacterium]|nr:class I SAM-dependent methyltransferase [Oscillospiraceae bacterium]